LTARSISKLALGRNDVSQLALPLASPNTKINERNPALIVATTWSGRHRHFPGGQSHHAPSS
jgi:hypothetical protein